jgi:tetratricopeptide (TPR) repeat protein
MNVEVGAFAEGLSRGEEGVQVAEAVDEPFSLITAYIGIGMLYLRKGDLLKATPVLERALGICEEANQPVQFARVVVPLGTAYILSGRVAEALPLLERALELRSMIHYASLIACLGEAYLLTGRLQEATDRALHALDYARTHKQRGHQAQVLRLLGDIAMHHDPPDIEQAKAHYQQALALADELGMRPLQAHCHRGLGTLYSVNSGRNFLKITG